MGKKYEIQVNPNSSRQSVDQFPKIAYIFPAGVTRNCILHKSPRIRTLRPISFPDPAGIILRLENRSIIH
jgi:hypothetical protein